MKIEKLTIAMHCNLKPSDFTPVGLVCNYEVHNTLAYIINISAISFGCGNLDFLSSTAILAINGHLTALATFSLRINTYCYFLAVH